VGCLVAFDDFAKGQSRISDLVTTPPDFLKIDRELITGLCAGGPKETLLRGLVDTCGELEVSVIAEGVETEEEHEICLELGIPYIQGFYLARPAPAYELFGVAHESLPPSCPFRTVNDDAMATV
jgi:EAL domain-containing protein (putative c-di-GMP-specific phosphodiesterase class I)